MTVPTGTWVAVVEDDGRKRGLADLLLDGDSIVVARGGEAGRGNKRFAGPTNQEPMLAEVGEDGQEIELWLEVKLLADVAIVGAPNAGKSTLLRAVSRARPKVAAYPFTTIEPALGVVEARTRSLVLLEVPGLIEGAHVGKGLGLEFLRHAERVQALVQLLDGEQDDLVAEYWWVAAELEAYEGGLGEKQRRVVVNKVDIPEVRARFEVERARLAAVGGAEPLAISAATGEGLGALVDALLLMVPERVPPSPLEESAVPPATPERRPKRTPVQVSQEGHEFVVTCREAERLIPLADLGNWTVRMQLHRELDRLGVLRALRAKGVESGDTVVIGSAELEWQ